MESLKLEIEIPVAIAGYLQMDEKKIIERVYKLLLADLASQGIISFGKAAELAGMDKMAFIMEMGHIGIPYFSGDVSEILRDADLINNTMAGVSQ